MTALARTALAFAGVLPAGVGVLLLTGMWNDARPVLRSGLALFAGLAVVVAVLPPLVYLGVRPSLPAVIVVGAAVLGMGLAADRARGAGRAAAPRRPASGLAIVAGFPFTALLALLAVRGVVKLDVAYDAVSNWGLKAKLLYFAGAPLGATLDGPLFEQAFATSSDAPPVHRAYPIGLPSLEAYVLDVLGGPSFQLLNLVVVAFVAGLAATVWFVLRPHVPPAALVPGLVLVLALPALRDQALSGNADVPLACVWVAAALLLGSWVVEGPEGRLALASVFGAAAIATKAEGAIFCAVLWAVALGALLLRGQGARVRRLLLAGGLVALSAVPWRAFVAANDLGGHDFEFTPGLVLERLPELGYVLGEFGGLLVDPRFLGAVPVAAFVAALLLLREGDRRLGVGFLVVTGSLVGVLVLASLADDSGTKYLVVKAAPRTLLTPAVFAAALLPLLVARLLRSAPEPPAPGTGGDRLRAEA